MRWRMTLLPLATIAWIAAVVIWLSVQNPGERGFVGPGSIYDTSPDGASLAFEYLRARRGEERVRLLETPVSSRSIGSDDVVIRMMPWIAISSALDLFPENSRDEEEDQDYPVIDRIRFLNPAEEEWIRAGGRLLLASSFGLPGIEVDGARGEIRKVFPVWSGVRSLEPPTPRAVRIDPRIPHHSIFTIGGEPLVARFPLGKGEVLLIPVPEILTNETIGRADHLLLLESGVGGRGRIWFDEGLGHSGLWDLLVRDWRLGPAILLLALAGMAQWWRSTASAGIEEREPADRRSEAIDLVDSIGALYDRALDDGAALRLYRRELERETAARTGLSGKALEDRVRSMAGPPPGERVGSDEFRDRLRLLNEAFRRLHAESR
jgi:hypothetical protein